LRKGMKLLIADDDKVSCKILERDLSKWGYEVIVTHDGRAAWEAIKKHRIQLAILDWMMPIISGIELCRKIRNEDLNHYTYIILLSAKQSHDDMQHGFSAEIDDYITKPYHPWELNARLATGQRVITMQNELEESRRKLKVLAEIDGLTGIFNRNAIIGQLKKELYRSQRENNSVGILMLDIDNFKEINDTLGHQAGDTVMREFASRLKSLLRPYDEIGRYGGDEFLIVIPKATSENIGGIAERIRSSVESERIAYKGHNIKVTLSLGCAVSDQRSDLSADDLIAFGDLALYQAKTTGRNRVVVHSREHV